MITLGRRGRPARAPAGDRPRSVAGDRAQALIRRRSPAWPSGPGGYARIVKLGPRQGGDAATCYWRLVSTSVNPRDEVSRLRGHGRRSTPGPFVSGTMEVVRSVVAYGHRLEQVGSNERIRVRSVQVDEAEGESAQGRSPS